MSPADASPLQRLSPPGQTPVLHLHLKVVPGASRAGLAGPYGDRLKVRVTAAAESGKANKAVLALLADTLGVAPGTLSLVRGASLPLKTVELRGIAEADARTRLLGDA